MSDAALQFEIGNRHPYDSSGDIDGYVARDWAHRAARGIVADLASRCGMDEAFSNVEYMTRIEIVESIAEIIRLAFMEK